MFKRNQIKIKKIPLLLTLFLFTAVMGQIVSEERSVSEFDKIVLSGSGEVILTQESVERLTIEAEKDILPYLVTEIRGRTLYLGKKKHNWKRGHWFDGHGKIKYYVSMKTIQGISISGSGSVNSQNIDTDRIKIGISGSGNIDVKAIRSDKIDLRISGSGDCQLAGNVNNQVVKISGSGSYLAPDLVSQRTKINISGSGKATVQVEEELDVRISGSGSIRYSGNPQDLSLASSGSGKMKKIRSN